MASHGNHVTNLMNGRLNGAVTRMSAGLPIAPGPDEPQPSMLQTFPFFHIGGLSGLIGGLAGGARLGLMFKWVTAQGVEMVEAHNLSAVAAVRQLLEAASAAGRALPSLLGVTSGGAAVPPDLIRRIGTQFQAKASPGNGYRLTETTSAVTINSGPHRGGGGDAEAPARARRRRPGPAPPRLWEEVAAVIQLVGEDGEAVAADILAVMAGRLARFKIPSAIRLTPQELPHTATGKLLKRDLRGIYFPPAARAEDSSAR